MQPLRWKCRSPPTWLSKPGALARPGACTLTFMVGGAVRGGDRGRSGTVTSVLFSNSCFLENQTQACQLPLPEPAHEAGDEGYLPWQSCGVQLPVQ